MPEDDALSGALGAQAPRTQIGRPDCRSCFFASRIYLLPLLALAWRFGL